MPKLYQDAERGVVNPELFDEWAQREAEKLIKLGLPSSQFRKFFAELRALEARVRTLGDNDEAVKRVRPYLKLLLAKVHYQTREKKKAEAYKALEALLRGLFDQVETRRDFDVVMDAVQAVMAYYAPRAR